MEDRVPTRLNPRAEARRFGVTVGGAFVVLGAIAFWRGRRTAPIVFGAVGAVLVLLGATVPGVLVPVRRAWMALATVMSKVTSPIFLGIVYFGLFAPVGALMRLVGRGPLKSLPRGSSRWIVRGPASPNREGMEHQF